MPKIAVVIPTYVRADSPQDAIHFEGFQMLKRALESLETLKEKNVDIVLPFCIEGKGFIPEAFRAYHYVIRESLSADAPSFRKHILTAYTFREIREYLSRNGFSDIVGSLGLCGYPNIRNSGLILSQALGADAVIFMDNDEIIDDANFIDVASDGILRSADGVMMDGKGGFYVSRTGELYDKIPFQWWQILWNKSKLFEAVWKSIVKSKERFVASPIVLGGNLVLKKSLFEQIPFDPMVPRGEDIDYLINARIAGFTMRFDKKLRIKHLPPERTVLYRKDEIKGDVERFLYEREKVKGHKNLNIHPYPGYFLKGDLRLKSFFTVLLFSLQLLIHGKFRDSFAVYAYLTPLFKRVRRQDTYNSFKERWKDLMAFVKENTSQEIFKRATSRV